LVVWQEQKDNQNQDSGKRFVVGEIIYNNEYQQINYFDKGDIEEAKKLGFRPLEAFKDKEGKKLTSNEISNALDKRVISKERSDFDSYLKSFMISPALKNELDTLTLLANTGRGKNFGDGFSFFPDIQNATPPFQITFEVAGHRHSEGMQAFSDKSGLRGKTALLLSQDDNKYDPYAVQISIDGVLIGYTPKGLSKGLHKFAKTNKIDSIIARVNGTTDRPNLIVYINIIYQNIRLLI
jgi:hypothetical protein